MPQSTRYSSTNKWSLTILTNLNKLSKIDATLSQEIAIHIISTDKSKLMIIDCSRIDPDQQDKILENSNPIARLGFGKITYLDIP